jgi:hypothetical protein
MIFVVGKQYFVMLVFQDHGSLNSVALADMVSFHTQSKGSPAQCQLARTLRLRIEKVAAQGRQDT